ncbi:hypothetical protein EVAR_103113_1 [Eumeta japonica]|uniref:Uncharacterized protein n=1 Tax=Eumeta variegata TaxID=151549 RepID=A0A4C1X1A1_EUMVA|nr:hypothetical protein EVAR_103113_1 [Eumeta japonica]
MRKHIGRCNAEKSVGLRRQAESVLRNKWGWHERTSRPKVSRCAGVSSSQRNGFSHATAVFISAFLCGRLFAPEAFWGHSLDCCLGHRGPRRSS